ncbi:unnamed protein product [Periconia digitata]|uniref:Uncharacterized protein n=1 Tax=Periconia digitata TaxID=1303443 RepID=A0A9W4XDT8_9PLEO|nr:unnamed protein product [Periconia digitata]
MVGQTRQTSLREVRKALNANPLNPYVHIFKQLLENGKNGPLKGSAVARARFGSDMVLLKKQIAFNTEAQKNISTPEKVRDILLRDLATHKESSDAPVYSPIVDPHTGEWAMPADDEVAAKTLINGLLNKNYKTMGWIASLKSPVLDSMSTWPDYDKTHISQTGMETCIMPNETRINLQHQNETMAYINLLVGEIVWMIWPPIPDNIAKMQAAYDADANAKPEDPVGVNDFDDVALSLVGGVTCVHAPGEVLVVPPFCMMLGASTRPTAFVRYGVFQADRVVPTLRMMPFIKSWWTMEHLNQETRFSFAAALADTIKASLSGVLDDVLPEQFAVASAQRGERLGLMGNLVGNWDGVKDGLVEILREEHAEELRKTAKEFLGKVAETSWMCAICGKTPEEGVTMEDHFDMNHWPQGSLEIGYNEVEHGGQADDNAEAADQMEGVEREQDTREQAGPSTTTTLPLRQVSSNANILVDTEQMEGVEGAGE